MANRSTWWPTETSVSIDVIRSKMQCIASARKANTTGGQWPATCKARVVSADEPGTPTTFIDEKGLSIGMDTLQEYTWVSVEFTLESIFFQGKKEFGFKRRLVQVVLRKMQVDDVYMVTPIPKRMKHGM